MKPASWLLTLLTVSSPAWAQDYVPPPSQFLDDKPRQSLKDATAQLDRAVASLRRQGARDPWLAEVEVYHKAAAWVLKHDEFYDKDAVQWTREAVDRGLLRAGQLGRGESPWLTQFGHPVVRAYRSRVDGSVQPYAVTWPKDYGKDPKKKWRLDVVLHGRDARLTEVKFLHQHSGDRKETQGEYVQLDIFGRGNNAYRWAGETDVFEAVDAFVALERLLGRAALLDPARVVLRGFSMGGAGTWHIGLHRPDRWCVIGPGAGFTVTHGYVKNIPDPLPPYQEPCLRVYDAADYAENAFDVPVVAYAGSEDPQLQAARNIEARLKPFHIDIKLLVGTGLAHKFPPEWQRKAEEAYAAYAGPRGIGRPDYPARVRFVTYTLKYPSCFWVEILALGRHYEYTLVDARKTDQGYVVETKNVAALRLNLPDGGTPPRAVTIDGQEVETLPHLGQPSGAALYLEKQDGKWKAVLPQRLASDRVRRLRKIAGLQGPIDDAFAEGFLCVRGTGQPWHAAVGKYAAADLERFRAEWSKYLRGTLPVKDDVEVTEEDLAGKHLILFGDPSSNYLIAQALGRLPLRWTRESVTLGDQSFPAADHLPALIYPSPFHPGRYVVLNSGHTFHAADFRGTNALLYPRLGDYAVLKLKTGDKDSLAAEVATAGLFDDDWEVKPGKNQN